MSTQSNPGQPIKPGQTLPVKSAPPAGAPSAPPKPVKK
jgi:hypothetical protein